MKQKVRVVWYPWILALLFAAIFVFVITKYLSQLKKEGGSLPKIENGIEEGEY